MQTSPFDAAGYPHHLQHHQSPGMYGSMAGFDPAGLKFHPHPHHHPQAHHLHPHTHHHPHVHPGAGGYTEASSAEAAAFYNYGVACSQDYGGVREPPSYADSTPTPTSPVSSASLLHHHHHPHHPHAGFAAADYYKAGGIAAVGVGGLRQMDVMGDYGGGVRTPVADNFLMKHESSGGSSGNGVGVGGGGGGGGGGSSGVGGGSGGVGDDAVVTSVSGGSLMDYAGGRYTADDLHHLHHLHHHHQQQHQHQQQQQQHLSHLQHHHHLNPLANASGDLGSEDCKIEPDSQPEYKPSAADLGLALGHGLTPALHHPHQLPQQQNQQPHHQQHVNICPHPDLQHQQSQDGELLRTTASPCSEDGAGEGAENSASHTDAEVNTSSRTDGDTPQPPDSGLATTASTTGSSSGSNSSSTNNGAVAGEDKATSNEVKPTLSYIALIAKSILESPHRRLNLGSIYGWIEKNFPYYKNRGQGWRNSVRHNLSLNDCFIKAGRCEDGKGNYWAIHPANMQDFLRGDFRQRRRSRRRGRKKDCELGMYHHPAAHQLPNSYLNAAADVAAARAQMTFPPSLPSIYPSPYTEAERRAYRLDEALIRQSMNNPLFKWYHQTSVYPPATSPSASAAAAAAAVAVNSYGGVGGVTSGVGVGVGVGPVAGTAGSQWPQGAGYGSENSGQGVYSPLNSSFTRNYSTPAIV